jgi:antitoxin HicB
MKDLRHCESLPYTIILRRDDEGDVVGRIEELPGCSAHGATEAEALENLAEARTLWITDCIERGHEVPEPRGDSDLPSGKWVQRVPRSLHKRLAALAKKEGVSLNQLATSVLAEAVGEKRGERQQQHATALVVEQNVGQFAEGYFESDLGDSEANYGSAMTKGEQLKTKKPEVRGN